MTSEGEWEVRQVNYSKGLDISFEVVKSGTDDLIVQTIMREVGDGWRNDIIEADRAHVHLIASAPNMLAEMKAAAGYLRNAMIDLETGATKATAIRTIEGGLKRLEAAIAKTAPAT